MTVTMMKAQGGHGRAYGRAGDDGEGGDGVDKCWSTMSGRCQVSVKVQTQMTVQWWGGGGAWRAGEVRRWAMAWQRAGGRDTSCRLNWR